MIDMHAIIIYICAYVHIYNYIFVVQNKASIIATTQLRVIYSWIDPSIGPVAC